MALMPVHRNLDAELEALQALLLRMAEVVDEQFADALNALFRRDVELAAAVRRRDDEVDDLEMQVDRQCERILALHHPVADELRMIITAVKINTDLERVGDHCKNIAKNTAYVVDAPAALQSTQLQAMSDAARGMFREVYDAYLSRDRARAERVLAQDSEVDRLHSENFYALVAHGRAHPEDMEAVAYLITASKALERISDHAKNIAESVIFLIEGIDVRHQRARPEPARGDGTA
jgi:phosphate transport system protein